MKKQPIVLLCLWALCLLLLGCSSGEEQRRLLAELEEQNRSGVSLENDSLAEALVAYFDSHGSPNERMRAKYILGRTYYCLGELPRALETYYEAADCADTTASDCDYKVLSRIHAQSAVVFHKQVQPRSELKELRLAEYYAKRGKDTLMAIECYALQAGAYNYLKKPDSVIHIKEHAAFLFDKINRNDRSAQTIGTAINSLLKKGEIKKSKQYMDVYERFSNFFVGTDSVVKGVELYFYVKGEYYLLVNKIDSSEFYFRKLLTYNNMNDQIAANKGLMEVFEKKGIPDSIAKYAKKSFVMNDSAYSLAEMENIQKLQASYNYEHNKLLAEQKSREAERAYMLITMIVGIMIVVILISLNAFNKYQRKKEEELTHYRQDLKDLEKTQTELQELRAIESHSANLLINKKNQEIQRLQENIANYQKLSERKIATLEIRLQESDIVRHLHDLLDANPPKIATQEDMRQLKTLINEEIPQFYSTLNTSECSLRTIEYEVCILIRCHFLPSEICKLMDRNESYISNIRKAILQKLYDVKGSPKDLDQRILAIK